MGKRYSLASDRHNKLLTTAIGRWHKELGKNDVSVALVMVTPNVNSKGFVTDPAITVAGREVAARVKLTSRRLRPYVPYEAVIEVDEPLFLSLAEKPRLALLDHELEHLLISCDSDGLTMRDDDGRVLLTLVPDDWCLTGFESVVGRHGCAALEASAISLLVKHLWDEHGQKLFPWMAETQEQVALVS